MLDSKILDDVSARVAAAIRRKPGARRRKKPEGDAERRAWPKLDLVTREEFDIQAPRACCARAKSSKRWRRGVAELEARRRQDRAKACAASRPLGRTAEQRTLPRRLNLLDHVAESRSVAMAVAVVHSRALSGVDAPRVTVEVHLAGGLPAFTWSDCRRPR